MDTKQAIQIAEALAGAIGSDDTNAIESAVADLTSLKEFLVTIDEQVENLNKDVERLNDRANALRASNNELMRKISVQDDNDEKTKEKQTHVDELAQLF